MILLVLGLALFAGLHMVTTIWRPVRERAIARIGAVPWKILIAVGLIVSVWLMVRGFGRTSAEVLWIAPDWARGVVVLGMLPVLILYMGSFPGSALRARVRHPQLLGFKLWAVLHLIANGEFRTVVLFGGLLAWAVVQLILLNRRDGTPPLPRQDASALKAWAAMPIGIVVWIVLLLSHEWLFGVSPLA